jgi:segregation and condensation protein A
MEDKNVPWWRRALSYALGGIRSGFGLFSRPQKENAPDRAESVGGQEADRVEVAALSEVSPEVNAIAAEVREEVTLAAPEGVAAEVEPEGGSERTELAETEPEKAELAPVETAEEVEAEVEAGIKEAVRTPEAVAEPVLVSLTPEPEQGEGPEAEVESVAAEEPAALDQAEEEGAAPIEFYEEPEVEPVAAEVSAVAAISHEEIATEDGAEIAGEPEEADELRAEQVVENEAPVVETPVEVSADGEAVGGPVEEPPESGEEVGEAEAGPEPEAEGELAAVEETTFAEEPVTELGSPSVELNEPAIEEPPEERSDEPAAREVDGMEETAGVVGAMPEEAIGEAAAMEAPVMEAEQVSEEVSGPGSEQGNGEKQDQSEEPGNETMDLSEPIPEQEAEPIEASETVPDGEVESEAETVPAAEETIPAAVAEAVSEGETEAAHTEADAEAVAVPAEEELSVAQEATPAAPHKPFIKLETRDNEADLSPFSVVVSQVYDGPLDLLLDLIRKQDIDIYDIPIARITAQFLAYVNQLKATDVDVAGEFIYTASLLIHIKSKMLLPRAPTGPDDAAEDPRRELVERLLEHERFKNAAQMLQQKQMLEAASWTNPGIREFKDDEAAEPEIAADTVDLVRVFRDILERARNRPVINVEEDSVTVGQMIQFLARRLTMEDKPVALRRLLSHTRSERALIAMFLALLELVRLQAILLRQDLAFSEIFIKKHTGFESVMNEGLDRARDDWK